MQSETQFYETVASGCQPENNSQEYQELILRHQSNRRTCDCSQPCNGVNICDHKCNVNHNNDVTDASNCANCYCAGAEALAPDASSQADSPKQGAEYLEIVASDVGNYSARGDSKPSSRQGNCRDQHDDDYLQPVVDDNYLQPVVDDNYLQHVALDFSGNAIDSSSASHSARNTTTTAAQAMSGYVTEADRADDPSAPSVYNEINPPQMYDNVSIPSTLISSFAFDMEESSLSSQFRNMYHRKLPVKQLGAVVTLLVVTLVLPAASVWPLLHSIFLLPPNSTGKVAFCALLHRPLGDSRNEAIDFDEVNINEGSAFDRIRLSARQRSYYWLAASADLNTKQLSSLLLHQQHSTTQAAIEHAQSQHLGFSVFNQLINLSISLFDIRLLETDDTVHLTSIQAVDSTSAANLPAASFLGFGINGIFNQLFAKKYEIDSTVMHTMTVIDGESVANVSSSNKTGSENKFRVSLQVPVSGVYLMTTSIHCITRSQENILGMVNSSFSRTLFVECRSLISSTGIMLAGLSLSSVATSFDTRTQQNDYVASSSALVNLAANNDQFVIIHVAGLPFVSVSLVRYAVQLVLYKPVNADNTVAWSVVTALLEFDGFRNKIFVTVNEGKAYDNVGNRVIVPVTGVYYLMLTVQVPLNSPSRHRIMLNANTTALEVSRQRSTVSYDVDFGATDKSIILSLATNDVLTYHFSELPGICQTTFSGFLLYPKL